MEFSVKGLINDIENYSPYDFFQKYGIIFKVHGIIKKNENNNYYIQDGDDCLPINKLSFKGQCIDKEGDIYCKIGLNLGKNAIFLNIDVCDFKESDCCNGDLVSQKILLSLFNDFVKNNNLYKQFYTQFFQFFLKNNIFGKLDINIICSISSNSSTQNDITGEIQESFLNSNNFSIKFTKIKINNKNELLEAINSIKNNLPSILVIARGGGEDFNTFNDMDIINTLKEINCFTISAIGHSNNISLVDIVSNAKFSTPTSAGAFLNSVFNHIDFIYNLLDKNKTLLDTSNYLSDENINLLDDNNSLSDKNKNLLDINNILLDKNKKIKDQWNNILDEKNSKQIELDNYKKAFKSKFIRTIILSMIAGSLCTLIFLYIFNHI